MATVARNPLSMRPHSQHQSIAISPFQAVARKLSAAKRARSPEPSKDDVAQSTKRIKQLIEQPAPAPPQEDPKKDKPKDQDKERKRLEREQEFRIKYSRAFPSWIFYFDLDVLNPEVAALRDNLERRVIHLGARVDDFYSKDVTHFITLRAEGVNKENSVHAPSGTPQPAALLGSPIRLRGKAANDAVGAASDQLAKKAAAFGAKIWSAEKLSSVLDRCNAPSNLHAAAESTARSGPSAGRERSLTRLLEDERVHGPATERDPAQKRRDYKYFSKGTYFVLIEDMRQELATIAAAEFPVVKGRDGIEKPSWPVLYCHPKARAPFVPYDEEKEERRRERAERQDKEREVELARRKAKLKEEELRRRREEARLHAKQQHDLRRSVSLNNLRRRGEIVDAVPEGFVDLDADCEGDSANASGFLASGNYVAASGNSVGITSTTGTTSTAGVPLRHLQLPVGLRDKLQQQVIMSRKVANATQTKEKMGPPPTIPDRHEKPNALLRKSRSTNTLRLPKRDEGSKPGYCESCRVRFEDFKTHIQGRRHRKYATDDANFASLDFVLSRVRRRTIEEVEAEKQQWASRYRRGLSHDDIDEDTPMLTAHDVLGEDDVQWDDWVNADVEDN